MDQNNNVPMQPNPTPAEQSANKKMTTCKSCGAQVAKNAKTCPACGAKNKKPIYKRWYFYAAIVVVLMIILTSGGGKDGDQPSATAAAAESNAKTTTASTAAAEESAKSTTGTTAPQIEYTSVTIEQLLSDLKNNAYNAKQTWNGKHVMITGGKVLNIDASGGYFSIESDLDEYWLESIRIDIPSSIRDEVMSGISAGTSVTVQGKISDVGEIMGYSVSATEVDF